MTDPIITNTAISESIEIGLREIHGDREMCLVPIQITLESVCCVDCTLPNALDANGRCSHCRISPSRRSKKILGDAAPAVA